MGAAADSVGHGGHGEEIVALYGDDQARRGGSLWQRPQPPRQ